jgi:peptidoglycan/LPS O-acetylase OafA/YrhL
LVRLAAPESTLSTKLEALLEANMSASLSARTTSMDNLWRNPSLGGRIPLLDGLRGMCIVLVVAYHFVWVNIESVGLRPWQKNLHAVTQFGLVGLEIFFVLSGFLIGGILLDAKHAQNYFRTFYGRRFCRVLPLYTLIFGLFLIGLHIVGPDSNPTSGVWWDPKAVFNRNPAVWSYAVFLQNVEFVMHHRIGPVWMAVTWSLALEEQFYALLPALVRILSVQTIRRLGIWAIFVALFVRLSFWFSGDFFFGEFFPFPSRVDAFGLGVLAALACRHKSTWTWLSSHRPLLYGLVLLFGVGLEFFRKYPGLLWPIGLTWIDVFATILLLLIVVNPGRFEKAFFGNRVLMMIGTVSYAIYVFHYPVSALLHYGFFGLHHASNGSNLAVSGLAFIVVLGLAALSWRYMEHPILRYAQRTFRYE